MLRLRPSAADSPSFLLICVCIYLADPLLAGDLIGWGIRAVQMTEQGRFTWFFVYCSRQNDDFNPEHTSLLGLSFENNDKTDVFTPVRFLCFKNTAQEWRGGKTFIRRAKQG